MTFKFRSLLTISALAATALLMTVSCKKSNSSSSSGTISVSVHDSSFQSQAQYTAGLYSTSQNAYSLTGVVTTKTDTDAFQIVIQGPVKLNVPVNTDSVASYISYFDQNVTFDWQAGGAGGGNAIYTVTNLDTTSHVISGTFSGSLYDMLNTSGITVDSLVMTNGKFNLTYTVTP
jgi:hypothetical protein